jgi:peptidoglycan/LPS O-acetylase OafA/YrhL
VADALATGCLLAGCYNWIGEKKWYQSLLRSRLFLLLPGAVFLVAGSTALYSRTSFYILGQSFFNVAIALCVDRYVRYPNTLGGRLLNCRPLVFVGVLSYSLYLWQQLFLNPMNELPYYSGFPQNLLFAIIAGLLSYYLIERPFLKLKSLTKREEALSKRDDPSRAEGLDMVLPCPAGASAGQTVRAPEPIRLA